MSCIVVMTVMIPGAAVAWPVVAAAAAAASAGMMGYRACKELVKADAVAEVELSSAGTEDIIRDMARGEPLFYAKGEIQMEIFRNTSGQVAMKVYGRNKSKEELTALGKKMSDTLTQQYAYHRVMTELKQRNFNVVNEEVEEDGTVRLQVRIFQG